MKEKKFDFVKNGVVCSTTGFFFGKEDENAINEYYHSWKKMNDICLKYGFRRQNAPEIVSEGLFSMIFGFPRVNATSVKGMKHSSFDLIDPKTGDTIQIKCASYTKETGEVGPTSFGPDSEFDKLYFLFLRCDDDEIDFYDLSDEDYQNWVLNGKKKITFKEQASVGKRPRKNLMEIIKKRGLKPFYTYSFL